MNQDQTNKQALARLDNLGAKKKNGRYLLYKMTTQARRPGLWGSSGVVYRDGTIVEPYNRVVDRRPWIDCSRGLNVLVGLPAPGEMAEIGTEVLLSVSVAPEDVACVPDESDFAGSHKLRVSKLKVIGRVNLSAERKKLKAVKP